MGPLVGEYLVCFELVADASATRGFRFVRHHPEGLLFLAYAVLLKPLQGQLFQGGRDTKLVGEVGRRLEGNCPLQAWALSE